MGELKELHFRLDTQFRSLQKACQKLTPPTPLIAVEYGVADDALGMLKVRGRFAKGLGFQGGTRQRWLPPV